MLYEYPQYVIYNEYAHMNRIRYFFRIHLKGITRIYRLFRRIMRNAFYVRLMGIGKLKKADTFFFVIDPRFNHPGLADRMKAIIACYNEKWVAFQDCIQATFCAGGLFTPDKHR